MNIHEYQAKQLFKQYGVAVPTGALLTAPEQAAEIWGQLGEERCIVKAQVHAGGRGKAGGVKLAESVEQLAAVAKGMLGTMLVTHQTVAEGLPIESVWVEKVTDIKREFYISLLLDRSLAKLTFMASAAGGMDIEEVAAHSPEQILNLEINPSIGLQAHQCRDLGFDLGLNAKQAGALTKMMLGMYQLYLDKDASQIEINPLVETASGELLALDAKINFDDNALALHADIAAMQDAGQEDEKENQAKKFDLNYITLQGSIGCMVNGAGLAMATMDLVQLKGGTPANFLDVGGGATQERVAAAFKLILSDTNVKALLVNIFGGIVRCDVIAEGILAAVQEVHVTVPVVVRLEGTNAEQGRALLNDAKLAVVAANDLADAAERVVALARAA